MSDRPIRDILAEVIRRERLGLIRPLWADWKEFADDECEHVRKRADHIIRTLKEEFGVELVQSGTPPVVAHPSPEIYRWWIIGQEVERVVRLAADGLWEILTIKAGVENIEYRFQLSEVLAASGMVLTGQDAAAKAIPGLGRKLAALAEICRVTVVTRSADDAAA